MVWPHHSLPFLLLSDRRGTLRKSYGVSATMGILSGRVAYIINKEGIVRHVFSDQFNAQKHITEALKVLWTSCACNKPDNSPVLIASSNTDVSLVYFFLLRCWGIHALLGRNYAKTCALSAYLVGGGWAL